MRPIIISAVVCLTCISVAATLTTAATYTVTNANSQGPGSLRAAVASANSTPDNDIIVFSINGCPSGICIITPSQLDVIAAGTLTITNPEGPQHLILRGGYTAGRIFYVQAGAHLEVDGVTMQNGEGYDGFELAYGGAVFNIGFIRISNCVLRSNIANAGGAIANLAGTVEIIKSEITDNNALSSGGGIFSLDGTMRVVDSTIANNLAGWSGGEGWGGGAMIAAYSSYSWTVMFANCTISGNRTQTGSTGGLGGGVYLLNSKVPVLFINATITNNFAAYGGAVAGDGLIGSSMLIRNTIVSGNSAGSYPNISTNTVSVTDLGNNLVDQSALLSTLANNGGPTRTHALLPGSPAINSGNNCVVTNNGCGGGNPALASDQRGAGRVGNVDIGAFEFQQQQPRLFDFDGDGKTDIGIIRGSEWWINASSNGTTSVATIGSAEDVPAPADFTGDGKTDVTVFSPKDNSWQIIRSDNFTREVHPFGRSGDRIIPRDYDGDGVGDIAVFRSSDRTWWIRQSRDGLKVVTFGLQGDLPVPADYDGDGKTDIAVFRPSDGTWWIDRTTMGVVVFTFGISTDKLVPADYTGDGKADVAVWRPSNGYWYVLRSEDASYFAFPWGNPGDVPAPGDYDGDGRFDSAVFRAGTWYVNRTTGTPLVTSFGIGGDRPIPSSYVP